MIFCPKGCLTVAVVLTVEKSGGHLETQRGAGSWFIGGVDVSRGHECVSRGIFVSKQLGAQIPFSWVSIFLARSPHHVPACSLFSLF